ncbi:ABSCISIC ACID-INSENSITIVE 5-like protein 2 [Bienertia sinuspersici]
MGELVIGVIGFTQLRELQTEQLSAQNTWYIRKFNEVESHLIHLGNRKFNEVESHLVHLGKKIESMNLEEFIKNAWTANVNQPMGMEEGDKSNTIKSLQSQGSLTLSRTASEKIVDEVWKDIQQGERIKSSQGVKREPSMGEMTLEDFLEKTGTMDESSLDPIMPLDTATTSHFFSQQIGLSPAPSIDVLSDTPISARKRCSSDNPNKGIEKRLKRKIKNRESAARSRARKQAYHNELVSKVSCLEEKNLRLKKEKVIMIIEI